MDVKKIRDFINDDLIFKKGLSFYDRSTISSYSYKNKIIEATTSSVSSKPCIVQIKLDPSGNPGSAFCSCYNKGKKGMCSHIAAVLIYELDQNRTVDNPINKIKDTKNEVVIKLTNSKNDNEPAFDFKKYFQQTPCVTGEKCADRMYKLIFVLSLSDGYPDKRWMIHPALRDSAKNGNGGRIEVLEIEGDRVRVLHRRTVD